MGKMKDKYIEYEINQAGLTLNHTQYEMSVLKQRKENIEAIAKNMLNAFDEYEGVSEHNKKMIAHYKKELTEYFRQNEL